MKQIGKVLAGPLMCENIEWLFRQIDFAQREIKDRKENIVELKLQVVEAEKKVDELNVRITESVGILGMMGITEAEVKKWIAEGRMGSAGG